jgi:hypothetical protein
MYDFLTSDFFYSVILYYWLPLNSFTLIHLPHHAFIIKASHLGTPLHLRWRGGEVIPFSNFSQGYVLLRDRFAKLL